MPSFALAQEEYEALIALARQGASSPDQVLRLDAFLRSIEKRNGITRYAVWVQWQEADQPLPPTATFPRSWPPEMRYYLELLSRPIARTDVEAVLTKQASKPVGVLVTRDPAATVGWMTLDAFFTA